MGSQAVPLEMFCRSIVPPWPLILHGKKHFFVEIGSRFPQVPAKYS